MPLDGSAEDEIRRFEEQYRRQPESLVFARLADAYRKAGEPGRALELLEEGIARHRDYLSAHIVRARTFRDLGRAGDAREAFESVLALDAQNLVAMRGLADLARLRGDPAEEQGWLRRLVQADPFNEEPAARLAELDAAAEARDAGTEHLESPPPAEPEAEGAGTGRTPDESSDAAEESPVPAGGGSSDEAVAGSSDVVEPGLSESADGEPPVADEARLPEPWWFEEPEPGPEADAEEIEEDADLLTRTMAELYARQGLLDEAEEIYRELLRDRPDEAELRAGLDAVLGMRAARSATRGTAPRPAGPEVEPPATAEAETAIEAPGPGVVDELRELLEKGRALVPRLPVPPEAGSAPVPRVATGDGAEEGGTAAGSRPSVLEDWLLRLRS
jgi:tetratricopeptide (TPR) repeat protein